MASDHPIQALAKLYDLEAENLEDLERQLRALEENTVNEVFHWQTLDHKWQPFSLMLESVQQHSAHFFLIWGTEDLEK